MQHTYHRDAPQPPCCCLLLCCHCSAVQVQLVWLCNHWVRLHSCTLPVLFLKLLLWLDLGYRVQTFFVSLSWVSVTWVPWLGYLEKVSIREKTQQIVQIHLLFIYFPPHWGNSGEKFKEQKFQNYCWSSLSSLGKSRNVFGVHFVNLEMFKEWKF